MTVPTESYTLPNGLSVTLAPDRRLPVVVVNTWFGVGSRDEAPGRTGFAHLFEHLMFMGTARVPGNQFDVLMETGGGSNNASTSNDRTNYYSSGPSSILPLLLWLDADRLESLGASMTTGKLDLQRDVVRNEMRQVIENTPYGIVDTVLPPALYPPGHPYYHPVIGSHQDLQSATLEDVKAFFAAWYVPANASLVVVGDFDPAAARALIEKTFGAVPARPVPARRHVPPATLDHEVRRLVTDKVEFARLYLVWHAPQAFSPGSAEIELAAGVLAGSPSSRLEKRLVQETGLAQSVVAIPEARDLGSLFEIRVTAAAGADLERIKHEALDVVAGLSAEGPTAAELERVKAQTESAFLRAVEDLGERADLLNLYRQQFGTPDGFSRDLARYRAVTASGMRDWCGRILGAGRVDLRVLPENATSPGAHLGQRPDDLGESAFVPPVPERFELENGIEVLFVPKPGGLFSGHLVVDGGERIVPRDRPGLASLTATLLTTGAAGKNAAAFAEAVESLGATIRASGLREAFDVGVGGLASRLEPTLDLFADAVLRPNLAEEDFRRESTRAIARIEARADNPGLVAAIAARRIVFGENDHRGRALDGNARSLRAITLADVRSAAPMLLDPRRVRLVFVGDLEREPLRRALESRFGRWTAGPQDVPSPRAPVVAVAPRVVLVPRPGAPQTVIHLIRPLAVPGDDVRAVRDALNTILGGSFTSRLNQNLREAHGYTYGAHSSIVQEGTQTLLRVTTSVETDATGAALGEIRKELARLTTGDASDEETKKAVRTARQSLVEAVQTTSGIAAVLATYIADGRPADALQRDAEALGGVTTGAINAEARAGLVALQDFALVLVGDEKSIRAQLAEAGLPGPEVIEPASL